MERIKLVVVNGHTLGYILPQLPTMYNVLHASILKGATFEVLPSSKMINQSDNIKLASKQDFEDFRVHFGEAFANKKEYEYQE